MLSDDAAKKAIEIAKETAGERQRVRRLADTNRWLDAEDDRDRLARFLGRRQADIVPPGAESVQGDTVDFQNAAFLPDGARARRAVGFVEVNAPARSELGSGFLVTERLFLTNQHVIRDAEDARAAQVTFDREFVGRGLPLPTTVYRLDPSAFCLFSSDTELDYALVAVGPRVTGTADVADLGFCPIANTPDRHVKGMNVNIIQHPRGLPKMISVRNNLLAARTERTLLYETDTETGSSGSPVFNDDWEVVALHHWGQPTFERKDDEGLPIPLHVNEGIRISRIFTDLAARLPTLDSARRALLERALSAATVATGSDPNSPTLSGPRRRLAPRSLSAAPAAGGEALLFTPQRSTEMFADGTSNECKFTIPIEITVRVGGAGSASGSRTTIGPAASAEKTLTKGAEALQLDRNYSNREGYKTDFIPGVQVPLPTLGATLQNELAPLRVEEPNYKEGELRYTHFSLKLNRSRKMAIFTATNIDGDTYLVVDRRTGRADGNAEGETWFDDPRVSKSFYLDQSFYSAWSVYFDRGHLTRRTDPTWGTPDEAERANADTFHFPNCSPQHFRFNQTTKYWQGAERYVLENGVLVESQRRPVIVFQGPIFDDTIDHMADDVQIPSSFFKVIVWRGADGKLKSVGLIVDQLPLLSEKRRALGGPRAVEEVDVSLWRVPIATIEKRTDLAFAKAVRDADTSAATAQPNVGEAARGKLVRSSADLFD